MTDWRTVILLIATAINLAGAVAHLVYLQRARTRVRALERALETAAREHRDRLNEANDLLLREFFHDPHNPKWYRGPSHPVLRIH